MTGIPLPFPYRSRSNNRDNRDTSRHRSPKKLSHLNSKLYYGNNNFKPPSRRVHHTQDFPNYNKPGYNTNNTYSNNSRTQSPHYNRDGNHPRRPFSRNRLHNLRNYINSLLDRKQTDDTMSNTEKTETQNVSEEHILEQQFNVLLLILNRDTQDEYSNCQEKCNTLTEEYILSTSCKSNVWVLPLTIYTQQTPNHTKKLLNHTLKLTSYLTRELH